MLIEAFNVTANSHNDLKCAYATDKGVRVKQRCMLFESFGDPKELLVSRKFASKAHAAIIYVLSAVLAEICTKGKYTLSSQLLARGFKIKMLSMHIVSVHYPKFRSHAHLYGAGKE